MKKVLAVLFFISFGCQSTSTDGSQFSNLFEFPVPIGAAGAGIYNGTLYVFGGSDDYAGTTTYRTIYQ